MHWTGAAIALIGVAAALLLRLDRNARRKRAVWIGLVIAADVAFIAVGWMAGLPAWLVAAIAPCVAFGGWQSIRRARFCAACGGNHFPMDSSTPPDHCRHCGARLAAAPAPPDPR